MNINIYILYTYNILTEIGPNKSGRLQYSEVNESFKLHHVLV